MPTPKTIFDEVLDELLLRLDADPELDHEVTDRLRQLLLVRDFKPDSLREAISKVNLSDDQD